MTNLIPEMLNLVDDKKIAMRPAVEISYLTSEEQLNLANAIDAEQCTPSHDQTLRMKRFSQEGKLTQEAIQAIMSEAKPNQRVVFAFLLLFACLSKSKIGGADVKFSSACCFVVGLMNGQRR